MDQLCENYEEWKHCITVKCKIPLTEPFVSKRISALSDPRDASTTRFIELYGEQHRDRTVEWFQHALTALRDGREP